jgi:hypothetical protein
MATSKSSVFITTITDQIFTPSKIKRLKMSARAIINGFQIDRVYKEEKGSNDQPLKKQSRNWLERKAKILSGNMKGRGGKGKSITVAKFKSKVASLNTPYTAKSASNKMRFSGKLLTKFDVPLDSIKIVKQRNNKYRLDFSTTATAGGKDSEIESQLKGLKKLGYEPLGFKTVPSRLRKQLEQAMVRILNDNR